MVADVDCLLWRDDETTHYPQSVKSPRARRKCAGRIFPERWGVNGRKFVLHECSKKDLLLGRDDFIQSTASLGQVSQGTGAGKIYCDMGDDLRGKLGEHSEGRVNPSLDVHRILEVMDVLYSQVCGLRNGGAHVSIQAFPTQLSNSLAADT